MCREVVVKQHRIESYKTLLSTYVKYRDKRLGEILREQPLMKFLDRSDVKFKSFKYQGKDIFYYYLQQEIKQFEEELEGFKNLFYNELHNELEDKSQNEYFWGYTIDINQQIPVALSGRGNFVIYDEEKAREIRIELILNVLPAKDETIISIFSLKEHENYVNLYLSEYLKKDFGLLNMIESWMIRGSDHWFINPSIWESITTKNQEKIITEITNLKVNIATPFEKTIFNKLKRENFESLRENKTTDEFEIFLKKETEKLTDID